MASKASYGDWIKFWPVVAFVGATVWGGITFWFEYQDLRQDFVQIREAIEENETSIDDLEDWAGWVEDEFDKVSDWSQDVNKELDAMSGDFR